MKPRFKTRENFTDSVFQKQLENVYLIIISLINNVHADFMDWNGWSTLVS